MLQYVMPNSLQDEGRGMRSDSGFTLDTLERLTANFHSTKTASPVTKLQQSCERVVGFRWQVLGGVRCDVGSDLAAIREAATCLTNLGRH